MAEMLIILRRDPQSGKQNIVVKLDSDPDALPVEHEQLHRTLVEKLIGKGLLSEGEATGLIIEREAQPGPAAPAGETPEGGRERAAQER